MTSTETNPQNHKKILVILIVVLIIILAVSIIIIQSVAQNEETSTSADQTPATEEPSTSSDGLRTENTETTVVVSCAPEFAGGTVTSHTNSETTWSYYFSGVDQSYVLEYIAELTKQGWATDSAKTIAGTSFYDMQSGTCSLSLRHHSPDNGVILEVKETGDK